MNITKKLIVALMLAATATVAIAEDGSDRVLSGTPSAQQPKHIQSEKIRNYDSYINSTKTR